MALTDNLISFWEMEASSGTRYDAHNGNDLTDNNSVTSATGIVGNAADFESGNSEYLSVADNASLSVGDIDFTWALWIKLESKIGGGYMIFSKTASSSTIEYELRCDGDAIISMEKSADGSTEQRATWGSALGTGTWYFVIGYHDAGSNELGISINNGTMVTASVVAGVYDGTAALRFGYPGFHATNYYDGLIDQVGFWKRLLTADEITSLYNGGSGRSYASIVSPKSPSGGVGVGTPFLF
jgi:hypothetical protein